MKFDEHSCGGNLVSDFKNLGLNFYSLFSQKGVILRHILIVPYRLHVYEFRTSNRLFLAESCMVLADDHATTTSVKLPWSMDRE